MHSMKLIPYFSFSYILVKDLLNFEYSKCSIHRMHPPTLQKMKKSVIYLFNNFFSLLRLSVKTFRNFSDRKFQKN